MMKYKFLLALSLSLGSIFIDAEEYPIVILGSGPAGASAAIYAARSGRKTLMIEGNEPGGQITLSQHVENFPGFPDGINGYDLGEGMRRQALRFGAQVISSQVTKVDLSKRPFTVKLEDNQEIKAKTLIVATGASPRWLGLESEKAFIGHGVHSCATCDGAFYKGKEIVVIGGGDTAIEDALFLTSYADKVTVIHRRDTLKAAPYVQKKAFANPKIHFVWNSTVEEIDDVKKGEITGVKVKNSQNNQVTTIPCQGVFIAIGYNPNTELFKGQLELNGDGYIITKEHSTATGVAGLFAAGDVADPKYRQVATAVGTGAMAGIDAYHLIQEEGE